jgi:hypothetical protein
MSGPFRLAHPGDSVNESGFPAAAAGGCLQAAPVPVVERAGLPGRAVIAAVYAGMVDAFGGVDAVAALMVARCGASSKGTISRMCSGDAGVTVEAMAVLEGALGRYPLSGLIAGRAVAAPARIAESVHVLAAGVSVQAGGAVGAVVRALSDGSDGGAEMTPRERAQAVAEVMAAKAALDALLGALQEGRT